MHCGDKYVYKKEVAGNKRGSYSEQSETFKVGSYEKIISYKKSKFSDERTTEQSEVVLDLASNWRKNWCRSYCEQSETFKVRSYEEVVSDKKSKFSDEKDQKNKINIRKGIICAVLLESLKRKSFQ